MNKKAVNWLFVTFLITEIAVLILLALLQGRIQLSFVSSLVISELILVLPSVLFVLITKTKWRELIPVKKIKVSTAFMVVLFTFLCMPLTTVINAITMLFSDNVVVQMSDSITALPFIIGFFFLAIWGPVCEEIVFRGVVYGGYRKERSSLYSILFSALLFGLIHLNFNQTPYAFVIGIILALLLEVTQNILVPIIFHVVFNGYTAVLLYLSNVLMPDLLTSSELTMTTEQLLISIGIYSVIALVTTSIAGCILVWIANNEGNKEGLLSIWKDRKKEQGKRIDIAFLLGLAICIVIMVYNR